MKTDDDIVSDVASSDADKAQKAQQDKKEQWSELTGGKYKSPEELAKAYKELESKVGSQGDEIKKSKEFAEAIAPVLEEIRNDKDLFDKLDERLRKRANPDQKPEDKDKKPAQDDVRTATSDLIIADFEKKYGITSLPPDEQKAMRERIGQVLYRVTGKGINQVDLRRLGSVLEDSYVLANKDSLIEKSKLEALASQQEADNASIPSISSKKGDAEETLNSEEATVAERLGLTREQYLSGKKGSANVKKR